MDFNNNWQLQGGNGTWDDIPTRIVWVVPVSITVQNTGVLWDPATTQTSEWVQLLPAGQDADIEYFRDLAQAARRYISIIEHRAQLCD